MCRFEKAEADLWRWRNLQPAFRDASGDSPELSTVLRAIDSSFKSEIQEMRIRSALHAHVLNESGISHVVPAETLTGVHLGDFDWWLTEATLRSLHSGIDGIAQLLNVVFGLGQDPDKPGLPRKVCDQLQQHDDLSEVQRAVQSLWNSPECRSVAAFVNHVKHAGFPERHGHRLADQFARSTEIDVFVYDSEQYGPWSPQDIDAIIDGFRMHAIAVLSTTAVTLSARLTFKCFQLTRQALSCEAKSSARS